MVVTTEDIMGDTTIMVTIIITMLEIMKETSIMVTGTAVAIGEIIQAIITILTFIIMVLEFQALDMNKLLLLLSLGKLLFLRLLLYSRSLLPSSDRVEVTKMRQCL